MNEYLFNKPLYVRSVINLRLNLGKIMRILSILFLTIIFSNSVYAQSTVWSPDFRVSNVKFIDLNLLDDAKNGCWTNLKEVREYADEKLRMKGAVLGKFEQGSYANAYDNTYYFDISVAGGRLYKDGTGPCIGSVNIFLHTMANINNNFHQAIMAGHKSRGVFQNNLNLYVITELQEILDKIK